GSGIAPGPFPRTSRRTRRAPLNATGSPRFLPSGCYSSGPGAGDFGAAVAVPGDRYRRDLPQLGPARGDWQPPAPWGGARPADALPPPAGPRHQHADDPPPGEVVQHGEDVLGDRVPEVAGPAVHDLAQPGQHPSRVEL